MKISTSTALICLLAKTGMVQAGPFLATLSSKHDLLQGRAAGTECGEGYGSCNSGSCCSESGYCGTDKDYCAGSSCQLDYSDSCDTL